MNYVDFASRLLWVAGGQALAALLLSVFAIRLSDLRLVRAARRCMVLGGLTTAACAAALVTAFFLGEYWIQYVFSYSERKLAWPYKIAGLWAGLDGSILFWATILGLVGAWLARGFGREESDPQSRRMEPYVYLVYASVQVFFLSVIVFEANPFQGLKPDVQHALSRAGLLDDGAPPADGSGLNPLLENYWMMIHPPSLYLGFILYTVPFAFGLAALMSGELNMWWIKKTRAWTMAAWLFNTNGIILGGLWAYEVLSWGGFWAWDPVENSSFLPWLSGTAFLHSVMIQERRGLLRGWNSFLILTTFVLSIFGTYLTRSGVVSSVHAFGSGGVGGWFLAFMLFVIGVGLFLLAYRWRDLRTEGTLDSLLSREGVFLLNNMVLLAIAAAVVLLTLWPKISYEFLGDSISVGVPVYNLVCTPFFVLLLGLTALGPGMAWIRTSWATVRHNFLVPALVALPLAVGTQYVAYVVVRGGGAPDGNAESPVSWADHLYPTFCVTFLAFLILCSLSWEVVRTVRNVVQATGQSAVTAFLRLVTRNNRRYGGYVVHCGIATLAIGVVSACMYQELTEGIKLKKGESRKIGPYEVRMADAQPPREVKVSAYLSSRVHLEVRKNGELVQTMDPERRQYQRTGYRMKETITTEVSIARSLGQDFYVAYQDAEESNQHYFTVFRKPLINLVWLGWLTMIAGGLFAALPMARKRVGIAS